MHCPGRSRLAQPAIRTDAVNDYREEMDVIGQWGGVLQLLSIAKL
jgi:hypothetical protein